MRKRVILAFQMVFVVVLALLAARNLAGMVASAQQATKGPETVVVPVNNAPSIYLSISNGLASQVKESANLSLRSNSSLEVVGNTQDLYAKLDTPQVGARLFVTTDDLSAIDGVWLKEKYGQGVALIGIGVPISELAAKVGVTPTIADLDMAYAGGRIQVSMIQQHKENESEGYNFAAFYTDFWADLSNLPTVVKGSMVERR